LGSDTFDFNQAVQRQASDFHTGTHRLGIREVSLQRTQSVIIHLFLSLTYSIDVIDGLKVGHVLYKNVHLEHLGHGRATILEQSRDVLKDLMGLLCHILFCDTYMVALGIHGTGTGQVNQTIVLDSLTVGSTDRGGLVRVNGFSYRAGRHVVYVCECEKKVKREIEKERKRPLA
jgi:hypothetical protein